MASEESKTQDINKKNAAASRARHLRRTEQMRQVALWLAKERYDEKLHRIASTLDSPKSDIVKSIVECALDAIDDDTIKHFGRAGESLASISTIDYRRERLLGYFRKIQSSVQATAAHEASLLFADWHEELDRKALAAKNATKRDAAAGAPEAKEEDLPEVNLDEIGADLGLL